MQKNNREVGVGVHMRAAVVIRFLNTEGRNGHEIRERLICT